MVEVVFFDSDELSIYGLQNLFSEAKGDGVAFHLIQTLPLLKKFLTKHTSCKVVLNPNHINVEQHLAQVVLLREQYPKVSWLLVFDDLVESWLKMLVHQKDFGFNTTLKKEPLMVLKTAVDSIFKSEIYCSPIIQDKINSHQEIVTKVDSVLTNSEREILKEIAYGKMTKEIALDRNVSTHTIITHRKNIFRKLGVSSIHEATMYAIKGGMIIVNDYSI